MIAIMGVLSYASSRLHSDQRRHYNSVVWITEMDFKRVVIIVLYTVPHMCFGAVVLEHNKPSAEADTFICGREATFTCNIDPAPTLMTWIKSTDTLTDCQGSMDSCFDATKDNYQFSSNVSIDQYYMKVNPVKLTDETTFTCDDGVILDDSKVISVATLPGSISLTETGRGNVTLQVTTDCVYPLSSVSIEWYYIEDIGGTPEVYNGFRPVESGDNSSCTSGDCASGPGVSQFTSSVDFEENSEYTDVYLFAKVKHSAAPVNEPEVNATTSKKYRILKGSTTTIPPTNATATSTATNPPTTTPIKPCDRICIISIVVPIVVVLLLSVCFLVCCWLRCKRNIIKKENVSSKVTHPNLSYDNDIGMTSDTRGYGENNRL